MNPVSSHIFLNTLAASLPIMIHCLLTENIQPRAVQSSAGLPAKPRCWFWGQRWRMRAEKLKREACEVLRFGSHKYSQEEKPRQSACDTSAETRRQTGRGGWELITQQSSSPDYSWSAVRSDWGHGGRLVERGGAEHLVYQRFVSTALILTFSSPTIQTRNARKPRPDPGLTQNRIWTLAPLGDVTLLSSSIC